MSRTTIVLAGMLAGASMGAHAVDTFRCKNDLVQVGDPKSSVQVKCGEPMSRDSSCQVLTSRAPNVSYDQYGRPLTVQPACETVEEWTYNPGVGDFYTTIRFERGVITSIKYGDRVK
jgi:hypothetical protein